MRKATYLLLVVVLLAVFAMPALSSNGAINGGGQLREPMGLKKSDWYVISFGVWAEKAGDSYVGDLEVNFHNVGNDTFDGAKFYGSDVRQITFYQGDDPSCQSAMNMTVYGELNHQPGYFVILRAGDAGSPGFNDTVRVELHGTTGSTIYDTHAGEFSDQSNCVGTARTGLDSGNMTIVRP